MTRNEIMDFVRLDNQAQSDLGLTENDRKEIFLTILQGSSDINKQLFAELCLEYDLELDEVLNIELKNEERLFIVDTINELVAYAQDANDYDLGLRADKALKILDEELKKQD